VVLPSILFNATHCQACLCHARLKLNLTAFALNCVHNGERCQLFHGVTLSYTLVTNGSSKCYFYPSLPPPPREIPTPDCPMKKCHFLVLMRWHSTGEVAFSTRDETGANELKKPLGVAVGSNGSLYIADMENDRIQYVVNGSASATTVAGDSAGNSGNTNDKLHKPACIVLDEAENMYITDTENHRVMFWPKGATSGQVRIGVTGQ
jgi:hypothetical protein